MFARAECHHITVSAMKDMLAIDSKYYMTRNKLTATKMLHVNNTEPTNDNSHFYRHLGL